MKGRLHPAWRVGLALVSMLVLIAAAVAWWDRASPIAEVDAARAQPLDAAAAAAQIERGRVLALAGNCATCHTARGGAPYAGGRALDTPFGTVYGSNLTPHEGSGLGRWSAGHFWRALHEGRGHDGRRLVPVFPYTETTRITREDSDALFAFLRTLPPVDQPKRTHDLRWPYGTQAALAVWRVLFFRPGVYEPDPRQSAQWNRGAYLVNGAAHCVACHGGRNLLGGVADGGFGGGLIPLQNWYAPALNRAGEASVADWPVHEIVALLRDGSAPRGQANGPMAEVVMASTQHLPPSDLQAMALYLKSLPTEPEPEPAALRDPAQTALRVQAGAALYAEHCAACHGATGQGGVAAGGPRAGQRVVPPLAGNRSVTQQPPANVVRSIALGGFGPVTAGNPAPHGMPPFAHLLSDEEIAQIATFLRRSWGAQASPVTAPEVARWRGGG